MNIELSLYLENCTVHGLSTIVCHIRYLIVKNDYRNVLEGEGPMMLHPAAHKQKKKTCL